MFFDKIDYYKNYVVFEIPPSIPPNGEKNIILINDVFGQVVATLSIKNQKSENQKLVWDTRNIKSGVYLYTLKAMGFTKSGKIIISK